MAVAGQVAVKFTADTAEYSAATERVIRANGQAGESMHKLRREAERVRDSIATPIEKYRQEIERLEKLQKAGLLSMQEVARAQEQLGKRFDLAGSFLKLAAVNFVANGLNNMAKAAEEFATQMRLGKASGQELFDAIAAKVPVLGKFWEAGRAIREVITGEKAYIEVLLEQARVQDERTAAALRFMDAARQLTRMAEDLRSTLTSKPGFLADVGQIVTGGTREAEDLGAKLSAQFAEQFKAIEKQRAELGEKLEKLREANKPQTVSGGTGGRGVIIEPSASIGQEIAATERSLAKLDERSNQLKAGLKQVEDLTREKIGRGVVTGVLRVAGEQFVELGRRVEGFVDTYVQRLPQMSGATRAAVDAARTDWQRYREVITSLEIDLRNGTITPGDFSRAAGHALWENAKTSIDQVKARIEVGLLNPTVRWVEKIKEGIDHQFAAVDRLSQAHRDRLDAAAALGNVEAKQAADRLRVEDEIKRKRSELMAIALDPKVTEATRKAALAEVQKLPALQQAMILAIQGTYDFQAPTSAPQLSANFSTNRPDAEIPKQLLAEAKEQTKSLKKIERRDVAAADAAANAFKVIHIGS